MIVKRQKLSQEVGFPRIVVECEIQGRLAHVSPTGPGVLQPLDAIMIALQNRFCRWPQAQRKRLCPIEKWVFPEAERRFPFP